MRLFMATFLLHGNIPESRDHINHSIARYQELWLDMQLVANNIIWINSEWLYNKYGFKVQFGAYFPIKDTFLCSKHNHRVSSL